MTISVVMIVKNEEKMLGKCLESVKEADSIVIVDTGSEDKTVEVAKKYTDKIFHFKWCDSFCKARNFANSKATGDWILSIDADEHLKSPFSSVRKALKEAKGDVLNVNVISNKGSAHKAPRLYRNLPDIYWKGDIHNHLSKTATVNTDIEIVYGYSPAHKKDPNRALRILKKSIKENPKLVRERYYLAREYSYRKQWKKCIAEVNRYLKVATWLPEKNDANLMKARCYAGLKDYNKACDCAWEAVKYNANFKEALQFIANHMDSQNKQRWQEFANLADNRNVLFVRQGYDSKQDEKGSEYYDKLFEKDSDMSRYENIYKKIGKIVKDKSVLDVGCGLAELSKHVKNYKGFDIAKKTIKRKQDEKLDVWVGNALNKESYKPSDYYTILEVLEHINKDIEVLESITGGQEVIFSVPSFKDPSHVRCFNEDFLRERYGSLLEIGDITYFVWDKEHRKWYESDKLSQPYILLVQAVRLSS